MTSTLEEMVEYQCPFCGRVHDVCVAVRGYAEELPASPAVVREASSEYQQLVDDIRIWQRATFPHATPTSAAAHLVSEAKELYANPSDVEEMADVFMLLVCIAGDTDLLAAARRKLEINKKRMWGERNEQGFVEHVREAGGSAVVREEEMPKWVKREIAHARAENAVYDKIGQEFGANATIVRLADRNAQLERELSVYRIRHDALLREAMEYRKEIAKLTATVDEAVQKEREEVWATLRAAHRISDSCLPLSVYDQGYNAALNHVGVTLDKRTQFSPPPSPGA